MLGKKWAKDIVEEFKNEIRDVYRISKIKKNKEKIIKEYESATSTKVKSLKKSSFPEIDKNLI